MLRQKIKPGAAVISVYVGLKGTAEELNLTAQNYFSYTTLVRSEFLDRMY